MKTTKSLYDRFGGYDKVYEVVTDLFSRIQSDQLLGRFYAYRGADGIKREKQFVIDFLCAQMGGKMHYQGRPINKAHKGMGITEQDWNRFANHVKDSLEKYKIGKIETSEIMEMMEGIKHDVVKKNKDAAKTSKDYAKDPLSEY